MGQRKAAESEKAANEPEPQFATDEDVAELEQAAKFWDDPEVKRLLAERARQEAADKRKRKGKG